MKEFFKRLLGKTSLPIRDEDAFAELVIAELHAIAPEIEVEYDPESFELRQIDQQAQGQKTFLHNSFVEYVRMESADRQRHIAKVARFIAESRKPAPKGEAALDMLLPVLRARADLLALASDHDGFPYERASQPFCENMLLMLALDSEVSIALVTDEKLDELGISFEQALGLATAHLDERGNHSFGRLAEGTFVSTCGDYYDASRVLIPGVFDGFPVRGNPVVIVQARSAILVTGSEDLEGLGLIAEFAIRDFPENERAISLAPIELFEGSWRLFPVESHHPLPLQQLRLRQAEWSYGSTQAWLQSKLGDDVFVASMQLYESEGRLASLASWAYGVRTACPLVEAVHIQGPDQGEGILRRLEDVLDICGPLHAVEEIAYPTRWMLPAHISSEQYERLKHDWPAYKLFPES